MGLSEDGRSLVQLYWIMGRSENSRNRIFVVRGNTLRTEPLHADKVADPSLIIYTAMREQGGLHIVTNGDQTDTVAETIAAGGSYIDALRNRQHEPDAPNWTPRIAGGLEARRGLQRAWLAIVKADPTAPNRSLRAFYEYTDFPAGCGVCISTYRGDGNPLPSFVGEPYLVPLAGAVTGLLESYWRQLNADNRIALALKSIDLGSGSSSISVVNRFSA
ncbi:MAG: inosine monophosphate cyclohydrolase [Candidatus Lambdaproteobacteria bacterium]|nr:inosine monophosphate cyclohydrolase [Candidatus Lambdaproteobacteria bacterium]